MIMFKKITGSLMMLTFVASSLLSRNAVASPPAGPTMGADSAFDVVEGPIESHVRKKQLTPLTETQLLRALSDAHVEVFGTEPKKNRLAMAWAQVGLESGRGKYIWNYNLGNVGPFMGTHDYYFHSPGVKYRSFDGFLEGGIAYWKVIKKCSAALPQFDDGQPVAATEALKRCNYFEADLDMYIGIMSSLFHRAVSVVFPAYLKEATSVGQD